MNSQLILSLGLLALLATPVTAHARPTSPAPFTQSATTTLDLNEATADELSTLPGIGEKRAAEIIRTREQRPFRSVSDLVRVPGIGPKMLGRLRPFVHVSPRTAARTERK